MVWIPGKDEVGLVLAVEEDELAAHGEGILELTVVLPKKIPSDLAAKDLSMK
jgi:hypothetical protein